MSVPRRRIDAKTFDRINPAVSFSVTRYVLAIGIFVAIVVFGVISMFSLGVDLLPTVNLPGVNVATTFTGASPSVIDQQVTQIIEDAVSTMSGITDLNSNSSIGQSRVTITFDTSVNGSAAANQTAALVNAAVRRLPTGTQPPVVRLFDPNSQPIFQFGVSGGGKPVSEISLFVTDVLAPILERVEGVANITTDGAPVRQFQILLNPNKMRFYNLNPAQVVNAVTASAVNQPIGTITTQGSSLTFSTQNVPANLDQIRHVLVDATRGITVADLAVVRDAAVESNYARIDGIPMVVVSVQRTTDSNSVAVVDAVRKSIKGTSLPAGYSVIESNDTTGAIRASIESTVHELFTTLAVVALIVLMFLGKPNTAFAVILAIPIALAACPILYKLGGFSFNLVSLLAMVIAIGIVVDDSIVVAENVERYRGMGLSQKDAVLKGASEVFSAVVAASLSLLSVLLPVSFIGGFVGRYLTQFSLGLAAAVALSLLEAILFLTVRLAYMPDDKGGSRIGLKSAFARLPDAVKWGLSSFRKGPFILLALIAIGALLYFGKPYFIPLFILYPAVLGTANYLVSILLSLLNAATDALHGATEFAVGKVRDAYADSLPGVLRRSGFVLVASGVFLGGVSFFLAPRIPFNFVPQSDNGVITVFVRFPPGTSQDTVNRASLMTEDFVMNQSEVKTCQAIVGNSAQLTATLTPVGTRKGVFVLAQDYRRLLQAALIPKFPTARISVGTGGGFGSFGSALQISIVSADFDLLMKRNASIVAAIQENPFVADVSSSLSDTNLTSEFLPNLDAIRGTGLTTQTIASALQTYATGLQASNVVVGGLSYPIMVSGDRTRIAGQQNLLDLPIYSTATLTTYQAGQLGTFKLTQSPVSLSRYNRQYQGQLNINTKPAAPTALEMQKGIAADLAESGLADDSVRVVSSSRFGQAALAAQLAESGPWIFALALFLAYLVMAAQFNSWRYPIYLLLPVPLALVGALSFVFFFGGGLDIFGLMGMLMLIGLSAKNAILYLDFVMERLGKMPLEEALTEAARLRFRPIVMTTLTVLVISFPLMFSGGQGAEFGQRMGVVMLGGILFSAILTFFVVPAAFYFFERSRQQKTESEAK